jgi:hypothetical protein
MSNPGLIGRLLAAAEYLTPADSFTKPVRGLRVGTSTKMVGRQSVWDSDSFTAGGVKPYKLSILPHQILHSTSGASGSSICATRYNYYDPFGPALSMP